MMKCIEGSERIARKHYECDYCGLLIPKGVEYVNTIWVGKEGWLSERIHRQCERDLYNNIEWGKRQEVLQNADKLTFQNEVLSPESLKEIKALLPPGIKNAKEQLWETKNHLVNQLFNMRLLEEMSDEPFFEKEIFGIMGLLKVFLGASHKQIKTLTMDEIADKFNIPVEKLNIKKD